MSRRLVLGPAANSFTGFGELGVLDGSLTSWFFIGLFPSVINVGTCHKLLQSAAASADVQSVKSVTEKLCQTARRGLGRGGAAIPWEPILDVAGFEVAQNTSCRRKLG